MSMKTHLLALLALAVSAIPMSAITVVTPSNGAVLTSPFKLTASTSTCGGVPAVSMGYSIDHNTAIIEPTSFTAMVAATPGAHVLHVKCWGKQVNAQVLLTLQSLRQLPVSLWRVPRTARRSALRSPLSQA